MQERTLLLLHRRESNSSAGTMQGPKAKLHTVLSCTKKKEGETKRQNQRKEGAPDAELETEKHHFIFLRCRE